MRIVGGARRGFGLAGPPSRDGTIRPTSDRLREAVFNILAHAHGDPVTGGRVLDLFSGTGALGLEALSRGASFALLVENGRAAQELIRRNLSGFHAGDAARLLSRDATRLGRLTPPLAPFTLVFCDPPYRRGLAEAALAGCLAGGWLAPGALVVAEEAAETRLVLPPPIGELDRRRHGGSEIVVGRWSAGPITAG